MEKNEELLVRTEHLGFTYEEDEESAVPIQAPPALTDINLTVRRGEYVAVLGHNGSGKSTLAKLLNMILLPTEGKIYIDGIDVTAEDFTEDDLFDVRRRVGMVFQNPDNQLVATLVEEDVAFGPENLGLPREEIRRRVDDALDTVGMRAYAHHAPHKLSGGQKQRVAIAGIIAMRPELIIFDESTAMLDPMGRREVLDVMEKLNREEGITILNITHYMEEAARADRIVIVHDGRLVADGTPRQIFAQVELLHEIGLEAPQGMELVHLLRQDGLPLDGGTPLDAEECADLLYRYLKREE